MSKKDEARLRFLAECYFDDMKNHGGLSRGERCETKPNAVQREAELRMEMRNSHSGFPLVA